MAPRTVVVIGATGYQGGSVVSELLQHPDSYQVRALTRNPASPAAQSLAARGADVRCADFNDGPDALAAAFQGAHAIYALTDFWQTQSGATETAQGNSIMDAAAGVTSLEHLIWSAIPDPEKLSNGRFLNINHWKSKSLVTEYIQQEKPELWAKTTTILFPNYFENCLTAPERYLPVPDANGVYTLSFPHSLGTVMPNVAIADTGKLVQTILNAGSEYFTKTIAFYSQALSEAEKLDALGKKYNIPTQYRKISVDEFQRILESRDSMSAEMAVDFAEQLMIFEEYGNIYARKEFIQAKEIPGLSLQTWADFLHARELPVKRA